jgi:curved DNA-binding protein CbpA
VHTTATPEELRRAYKAGSLQLHPDKNPHPNADQLFVQFKDAYAVLNDGNLREQYNRFGAQILDPKRSDIVSHIVGKHTAAPVSSSHHLTVSSSMMYRYGFRICHVIWFNLFRYIWSCRQHGSLRVTRSISNGINHGIKREIIRV